MVRPIDDVKNWMNMFRWIVKFIRDEYDVEESKLVRGASFELELAMSIEQREEMLATIAGCFEISFPVGTLDEIMRLDELCMLASWLKGRYKRAEFIPERFGASCRTGNAGAV